MLDHIQKPNNIFSPVRNTNQSTCMNSVVSWEIRNLCVCCRRELGVFMDDDKSCQTFPAKLLLPFTPSTNRKPTKAPMDREGEGDRLLPRAKHSKQVVKTPDLASVDPLIFLHVRSCVVYFLCQNLSCNSSYLYIYILSSKIILRSYSFLMVVPSVSVESIYSTGLQMLKMFQLTG